MSSEKCAKRCRGANYTPEEKNILLNAAAEFRDIIESKKTDAETWKTKEEAWSKIEDLYNCQVSVGRKKDSLQKLYTKLKAEVKKNAAERRREMYLTGGGLPVESGNSDQNLDLALSIMNPKCVEGLQNPLDSDAIPSANSCSVSYSADPTTALLAGPSKSLEVPTTGFLAGPSKSSEDQTTVFLAGPSESTEDSKTAILAGPSKSSAGSSSSCLSEPSNWSKRRRPIEKKEHKGLEQMLMEAAVAKKEFYKIRLRQKTEEHELKMRILNLKKKKFE